MKRLLLGVITTGGLLAQGAMSHAVTIQFAQFSQSLGGNGFKWTGTSGAAKGVLTTNGASLKIKFKFQDFVGGATNAGLLLNQDYNAILTITATSGTNSTLVLGQTTEALQTLTFSITADGAQAGVTNGELLLGGASTPAAGFISGTNLGTSASASFADTLDTLVFSSSAIILPASDQDGAGFGLSNVIKSTSPNTGYTFDPGPTGSPLDNFIDSFTAAGVGTFSTSQVVPEPGPFAVLCGLGVSGSLFAVRRRRRS